MTIFRWIIGVISALLAAGSILSLVVFMVMDIEAWITRARNLRRLLFTVLLFWFNVEVWGRVVLTLIRW